LIDDTTKGGDGSKRPLLRIGQVHEELNSHMVTRNESSGHMIWFLNA